VSELVSQGVTSLKPPCSTSSSRPPLDSEAAVILSPPARSRGHLLPRSAALRPADHRHHGAEPRGDHPDPTRPDTTRTDPTQPDPIQPDTNRPDPARPDPTRDSATYGTYLLTDSEGGRGGSWERQNPVTTGYYHVMQTLTHHFQHPPRLLLHNKSPSAEPDPPIHPSNPSIRPIHLVCFCSQLKLTPSWLSAKGGGGVQRAACDMSMNPVRGFVCNYCIFLRLSIRAKCDAIFVLYR